ncbi:MAG: type II toxin-antitoxin system HicA family toxin [Desulfovibrio sp.]|nr:type II toxin-antitoxin system HicA family toxin [Desulfovibrio sp.]
MPRLTALSWQTLECVLGKAGYIFVRQNGSHRVYGKQGSPRPLIIPAYKDVDRDIITKLLKTAQMNREDFFSFLEQCQ